MSKITIKGYVVGYHFDHMPPNAVTWGFMGSMSAPSHPSIVCTFEHSFDVETPADLNVVAAQIAAIEREKDKERAEFTRRVRELDKRAQKLMALEMA